MIGVLSTNNPSQMTQRASKIGANHVQNYEKASEEDIELIARQFEKRSGWCPPLEVIVVIPIILVSSAAVAVIPGFVPVGLYPNATLREQPICAPLDRGAEIFPKLSAPIVQSLLTFYLTKLGGDIMSSTMVGMIFSFDGASMSLLFQSLSVGIITVLIFLAYFFVHNILKVNVYSWRWFFYLFIATVLCGTAVFVRPECIGCVIGVIVTFVISGFSEVAAASGNRPVMFWRTGKLIFFGYLFAIPAGFFVLMARRHFGGPRFVTERILWREVQQQLVHESGFTWLFILISFGLIRMPKYRYVKVVPLISVVAATIATLFMPLESPGNATAIRVFFVRLNLILGAGIIMTNLAQDWLRFGIPLTTFSILAALKVYRLISDVLNGRISLD